MFAEAIYWPPQKFCALDKYMVRRWLGTCSKPGVTMATVLNVANDVVGMYLRRRQFQDALYQYSSLCFTVDKAVTEKPGLAGGSKLLIDAVIGAWIAIQTVTEADDQFLEKLLLALDSRGEAKKKELYYRQLFFVHRYVESKITTDHMVKRYQSWLHYDDIVSSLEASVGVGLTELTNMVIQSLHQARMYGVKPARFADGLLHQRDEVWEIQPVDWETIDKMAEDSIATIPLCRDNLGFTSIRNEEHIRKTVTVRPQDPRLPEQIWICPTLFEWCIAGDGHLYMTNDRTMPLRAEFERVGRGDMYNLIRFLNAMRLYDLTVPTFVVEQFAPLPTLDRVTRDDELPVSVEQRWRQVLDRTLILPRIKRLYEEHLAVQQAEEQEQQDARQRERQQPLLKHDVIGFLRRLPTKEGHNYRCASVQATYNAWEYYGPSWEYYGKPLPVGWTFVKDHKRGTREPEQPLQSHRVVQR